MARVLIVDDERGVRFTLMELLRDAGHDVAAAEDVPEATSLLEQEAPFDVVVTDIIMPKVSGLDLLERIRSAAPHVQIVVITGEPTVTSAARAVRAQAFDYLAKPVTGDAIRDVVDRAAKVKALGDTNRRLEAEVREHRDQLRDLVDKRTCQLRESEERFRLITDQALMGVGLADREGRITYVNERLAEILGFDTSSGDDGVGQSFLELVHTEDREWIAAAWGDRTHESQPGRYELRFVGRDGVTRWAELLVKVVEHGREHLTLVNVIDVTRRRAALDRLRQVESHLRHTQKMEAVGTLAGGVAHDINNVLGAIMGLASLLEPELEPGGAMLSDIEDILAACRRGRHLTRNLLAFARPGSTRRERLSLNQLVQTVVELLGRTAPKKVVLATDLAELEPFVEGDSRQLHHAVVNVCLNSVEALGRKGHLTIATDRMRTEPGAAPAYPELEGGAFAVLRVTDDGVGMDRATLEHAFEPFFTSRSLGRATGLGLSTVYGTVKHHGGLVTLESALGEGTTVTIYLPEAPAEGEVALPRAPQPSPSEATMGTVLLVDDEDLVRDPCKRMLERLGCSVHTASNGAEAVAAYERHLGEIDLVVLDMVMPVMDGVETFHGLRRLDPEARVLLCSGHSREGDAEALLDLGAVGFVQKPFDLHRLAEEVQAALSGRS